MLLNQLTSNFNFSPPNLFGIWQSASEKPQNELIRHRNRLRRMQKQNFIERTLHNMAELLQTFTQRKTIS